jgi:hypothetical protein
METFSQAFSSRRTEHVTSEARAFCHSERLAERLSFCERQELQAASPFALYKQGCFDNHNHGISTCRLIDSIYHGCNLKTETASKYPPSAQL